jgi:hypothetical protein
MMYQNVAATTQFETPSVDVLAVRGEPDKLAFYQADEGRWLTMTDPLNLRDCR